MTQQIGNGIAQIDPVFGVPKKTTVQSMRNLCTAPLSSSGY